VATPKPNKRDKSAIIYFLAGLACSGIPWGASLIGITVNIWLGCSVLVASFLCMAYAFWTWTSARYHIAMRVVVLTLAGLLCFWFLGARIWKEYNLEHQALQPKMPNLSLFMDCNYQEFPVAIPAGSKILVLQAHPSTILKHIGLKEIDAPADKSIKWPTEREVVPLPLLFRGRPEGLAGPNFMGLKCTLKKYGDPIAVDTIVIKTTFAKWGTYDLIADPLESQGELTDFSFYMLNYCYSEPPASPQTYDTGSVEAVVVLGTIEPTATLHVLGEPGRRQVRITIPFRNSLQPNFILPGSNHRWIGFPPC